MKGPGEDTEDRLGARPVGDAIKYGRTVAEEYEEQDDPNAFHVSRGRPTALIIPFPKGGR